MSDLTVANTILQQLGGQKRLAMMTGAKNFVGGENFVAFKIGTGAKDKINLVRVTLDPSDTYTVEFMRMWGANTPKVISKHDGIYNDMLGELFEKETGFFLKLAPGDQKIFGR